jgi:hypothetical protein
MDQPLPEEIPLLRERLLGLLAGQAKSYPTNLEERFPRILKNIVELWGSPEADAYFAELMLTERHDRRGFPEEVAMELFHLSTIHGALHLSDQSSGTGWAGIQDPEQFRKVLSRE